MSQILKDVPTLKCLLLGSAGSGKTSLLQYHLTGGFEPTYKPTLSVEECPVTLWTDRGPICFKVWEMTADGVKEHHDGANCAIILYDVSSSDSFGAVPTLMNELTRYCRNIPIALCASKFDLMTGSSKLWDPNMEFVLSVKLRHNLGNPFLFLAHEVYGGAELRMVPMPAPAPP